MTDKTVFQEDYVGPDVAGLLVRVGVPGTPLANGYVLADDIAAAAPMRPFFAPLSTFAGSSHNIVNSEAGGYLRFTSATAKTCTFRPNSTEAITVDAEFHIRCVGAGDLTLTPGAGVTLNPPAGGTLVLSDGMSVTVKRVATDEFDVIGQTVPA